MTVRDRPRARAEDAPASPARAYWGGRAVVVVLAAVVAERGFVGHNALVGWAGTAVAVAALVVSVAVWVRSPRGRPAR